MSRNPSFTQAQVRRAVKAADETGAEIAIIRAHQAVRDLHVQRTVQMIERAGWKHSHISLDGTVHIDISSLPPEQIYVYFVECMTFIKIGQTTNWKNRIVSLQTANPLPVKALALYKGDKSEERRLHALFSEFRHRKDGEWFRDCSSIRDYIASRKDLCLL